MGVAVVQRNLRISTNLLMVAFKLLIYLVSIQQKWVTVVCYPFHLTQLIDHTIDLIVLQKLQRQQRPLQQQPLLVRFHQPLRRSLRYPRSRLHQQQGV